MYLEFSHRFNIYIKILKLYFIYNLILVNLEFKLFIIPNFSLNSSLSVNCCSIHTYDMYKFNYIDVINYCANALQYIHMFIIILFNFNCKDFQIITTNILYK